MEDDSDEIAAADWPLLNEVVLPAWPLREVCFGNDLRYFFVAECRAEDVHANVGSDTTTEAGVLQSSRSLLMSLGSEACSFAAIPLMPFVVMQPSKLMTRVRFPSPAPAFRACGAARASRAKVVAASRL
jgi:hypothetical protein